MKLCIATWNMDHWKRMRDDPSGQSQRNAWAYLQGLGVDVALVQEALPPPFIDPSTWQVRSHPAPDQPDAWFISDRNARWGSAVAVFNPQLEFEPIETVALNSGVVYKNARLWISHPGSWAGIKLLLPDGERLTVVSAYGQLADSYRPTGLYYSTTSVNRMLSDLTPLIDSEDGHRMVIAGDLNIGTQYIDPSPEEPHRWGPMHRATVNRIEAFGFVDCLAACVPANRGPLVGCPCGPAPNCRHVRTHRNGNRQDSQPWQNDLFYATKAVAAGLLSCAPLDDEEAWALSDHCPVVAEFQL